MRKTVTVLAAFLLCIGLGVSASAQRGGSRQIEVQPAPDGQQAPEEGVAPPGGQVAPQSDQPDTPPIAVAPQQGAPVKGAPVPIAKQRQRHEREESYQPRYDRGYGYGGGPRY